VVAGHDRGAELALELQAAGVEVQALADARAESEATAAGGIPVLAGHTVLAARGSGRVTHAVLGDLRSGGRREIECDLLCLATGFEPAAGLIGQAGGRLRATGNGSVTLGELPPGVLAAGEGKVCHRLSIDLCASLAGRTLDETGATTARPPAQPVPLGALAARQADPVKLPPMHHQQVEAGAGWMDMGPWKRPLGYGSV